MHSQVSTAPVQQQYLPQVPVVVCQTTPGALTGDVARTQQSRTKVKIIVCIS